MKLKQINVSITTVIMTTIIFVTILSQFFINKSSCVTDDRWMVVDDGCPFPIDITKLTPLPSFSLKQISYKGVYNYPNVDITANYTIQSHNDTEQTMGVLFPFSMDNNITIHSIKIENQSIEPKWRINDTIDTFPSKYSKNLKLLKLELKFEALEERTIYIQYSLQYHTKTIQLVWREHRYVHFFEPAELWGKNSQSVHYEIWIPKSYLKNNGALEYGLYNPRGWKETRVEEKENYNVIISENKNEQVEATYIDFGYQDTIVSSDIGLIILSLIFLIVFSLLAVSIIIFYRKINISPSKENLEI